MTDYIKHKILILELIAFIIVIPRLSAQGLQFYGNKMPIEQRTSYILFTQEPLPVFSDFIDIEFDLRIAQSGTFGYLFHMINPNNNEAYSFTYSYVNDETSVFKFNTEGKINHISLNLPNSAIISQWLPVKLHVDLRTGESMLTIGKSAGKGTEVVGLLPQMSVLLTFGRREHLVDVPAFAIRGLKVSSEGQAYSFVLNESKGQKVHDSTGLAQGLAHNPYWLINDSYHWAKSATCMASDCMGAKFNEKEQAIQFITPDSLFTYQVDEKNIKKRPYANRMPVKMQLGTNFMDETAGLMYAYEINNLPIDSTTIAALDMRTLQWKPLGKAFTKVQLHHHNGFWDSRNHRYLVFGGFGNRLYSNQFLTYNEMADRWDTLHFKGDNIIPRFFSSMASAKQGRYLYIYGGVGNESGDQGIGHNYYNDLYGVDLERNTVKRLWSHPIGEKRVPSEQMIVSEDGKSLYVIRYAEYTKLTSLQLYRIAIENGEMEQLGDSIPFVSGSIASTVSLYHNSTLKEFYCVTQEVDEQDKKVKAVIYTLADPPVSKAEMEYYALDEESPQWLILLVGSCLLLVCGLSGWVFYHKRRKKRKEVILENPMTVAAGQPLEKDSMSSLLVSASPPKVVSDKNSEANKIYVYGMFSVYSRAGRDITHLFSKKLKYIFLYILLNSTKEGEGVNSYSLNEIFWPDKAEDKAKNLKGVTISNLRKALAELDGIQLIYEKGIFKIAMEEGICYCDYFSLHAHLAAHPQLCEFLLPIWERGKLLESVEYSLFDRYKQRSEDTILSLLPKDLPIYYQRNEYRYVLRICFIILKRDPLHEPALAYCVRSYKKLNDFESLSKIYSAFIIEYRKSMGEGYTKTVEELLQEDVSHQFS